MSLHVSSNGFQNSFIQGIQDTQRRLYRAQKQIETGLKVNDPSDAPESVATIKKNLSQLSTLDAFQHNIERAHTLAHQTHNWLFSFYENVHVKAQEVIFNGSLQSSHNLNLLGGQLNGLIEMGVDILQSKSSSGEYLFGGDQGHLPPYDITLDTNGQIASITYQGASATSGFLLSDHQSISPKLDQTEAMELAAYLNGLIDIRNQLQAGHTLDITTQTQQLEDAEVQILLMLTDTGIKIDRIHQIEEKNQLTKMQLEEQTSSEVGIDFTLSVHQLNQLQTTLEASMLAWSKIKDHTNLFNYL